MNTQQELINLGLTESLASQWLKTNKKHIGEVHGINRVTDITFVGIGKGNDIELTCDSCGKVRHKAFMSGRNRWVELAKTCSCQKHVLSEKEKAARKDYNDNPEYIGKVFGTFKVVEILSCPKQGKSGHTIKWLCQCTECGATKEVVPANAKSLREKCKCERHSADEYIGKTFGRLTVISTHKEEGQKRKFVCQCSCGNTYEADACDIKRGKVKSCGCISREISESAYTKSPLYPTWAAMLRRCENSKSKAWNDYGGRGITVCEEWHDFKKFEEWCIGNGYRPNCSLTLDRIDVNGNYEPSNCRYTTIFAQSVNRRPKKPHKGSVTINGVTKTKSAWYKEYGVWQATVDYRVKHMGMTFEEALTAEKQREGNHNPVVPCKRSKDNTDLADLNKINSYIECNLYMAFCRLTDEYRLVPQVTVRNYRLDFLVEGSKIAVECDGYDHHKTKEQMANDYKRERYLISQGYTVIRFTGSEINKNPDGCAEELLELIKTLCGDMKCRELPPIKKTLKSS